MDPINPSSIAKPLGPYSQGQLASTPGQWLHVSGQVGIDRNGVCPDSFANQVDLAWSNLTAVLDEAGMTASHLVKTTTFIVDAADASSINAVRMRYLGDARPASTLVVVKALLKPEWKIEVEAVAFKAEG